LIYRQKTKIDHLVTYSTAKNDKTYPPKNISKLMRERERERERERQRENILNFNEKTPINFQVGLQQLTAVMSGLEGNI
jgi:hypothetical protein